jgi:hypothetical protein
LQLSHHSQLFGNIFIEDIKIALVVILGPITLFASSAPWIAARIFKKNNLDVSTLQKTHALPFQMSFPAPSSTLIPNKTHASPSLAFALVFQIINVLTALSAGFVFGSFALHGIPESSEMFKEYLEIVYAPAAPSSDGVRLSLAPLPPPRIVALILYAQPF